MEIDILSADRALFFLKQDWGGVRMDEYAVLRRSRSVRHMPAKPPSSADT